MTRDSAVVGHSQSASRYQNAGGPQQQHVARKVSACHYHLTKGYFFLHRDYQEVYVYLLWEIPVPLSTQEFDTMPPFVAMTYTFPRTRALD